MGDSIALHPFCLGDGSRGGGIIYSAIYSAVYSSTYSAVYRSIFEPFLLLRLLPLVEVVGGTPLPVPSGPALCFLFWYSIWYTLYILWEISH